MAVVKSKSDGFHALTAIIERGIEATLDDIKTKYPNDNFYAYVLDTPGDLSSVSFHANSYENLEKIYDAAAIETNPAKRNRRNTSELSYYKWGWYEWLDYECIGDQDITGQTGHWLTDKQKSYLEEDGSIELAWFTQVVDIVLGCMKEALSRCDERGLFGVGKNREALLTFVSYADEGIFGVSELNPKAALNLYLEDIEITHQIDPLLR